MRSNNVDPLARTVLLDVRAIDPHDAPTLARSLCDVFDAPTRVVAVDSLHADAPDTTAQTATWVAQAGAAPPPPTELLPSLPQPSAEKKRLPRALGLLAIVAIVVVVVMSHGMWKTHARATEETFADHVEAQASASKADDAPSDELPTPPAGRERTSLTNAERATLEAVAVDALLSGNAAAAIERYRDLSVRVDDPTFARVVMMLERTP